MESIVFFNKPESLIEVKASGFLTASILENQMNEIIKVGMAAGVFKVLIDVSKVTELQKDQSLLVYTSNSSGYFFYATFGSLDEQINLEILKGVSLSVSCGLVVRHFPNRSKAIAWLKTTKVCS
jgi:hypothetical protein